MEIVKEIEKLRKAVISLEGQVIAHRNALKWIKGRIKRIENEKVSGKQDTE